MREAAALRVRSRHDTFQPPCILRSLRTVLIAVSLALPGKARKPFPFRVLRDCKIPHLASEFASLLQKHYKLVKNRLIFAHNITRRLQGVSEIGASRRQHAARSAQVL